MQDKDIGLIGLGVMGENLALNFVRQGFAVGGFDSDAAKRASFAQRTQGLRAAAAPDLPALVAQLKRPARLLLMVPAGAAVDAVLAELTALLQAGDVVIDGGNTLFTDTQRRLPQMQARGVLYVGAGVSGGQTGALLGPALMPGGSADAHAGGDCGASRRRPALLRLDGRGRRRPFRQDGAQRHRVRRHADHLRSLLAHAPAAANARP
jgi:6-phosphogluconate dehydrogenase